MRQQGGLAQHQRGHGAEIGQGAVVAEARKLFPRLAVAQLRLVAEGEQGFLAIGLGAGARNGQNLIGGKVGRGIAARRMGEGSVMAAIAAKPGEGDEYLA